MATKQIQAHDGLDPDKIGMMHEPLYLNCYRIQAGGKLRVPLPADGQRWTIEQARAIEVVIEQVAGGGDYEVNIADSHGAKHTLRYQSGSPAKPLVADGQVGSGSQFQMPPAFQQPLAAGPQAVPQQVDVPGIGKITTVPGMPSFITPTPANGKEREDIAGAATPWGRGGFQPWQAPWGMMGQQFQPQPWQRTDDGEAERARRESEKLRAELERERQESRHREEMSELKASISRLADQRNQPVGPSPELVEMRANQSRLEAELKAERERSAFEQRLAEERRASAAQFDMLKEELRRLSNQPKEDPTKPIVELMKSQAETARYQAEVARDSARVTAEAQKEAARDQRETMTAMMTSSRADSQSFLPTIMQLLSQNAQMQSSMASSQMEMMREVLELKGKDDAPWWGKMIEGALGPLPEVAMQLTRAYASSQQAKAAAALGGAQPQVAGELPPGRRPRVEGAPAVIEGTAAQAQLEAGQPPPKVEAPTGDAIARALLGYQSDVPGALASYDAQAWGSMLTEVQMLRKRIEDGKMGPKDAAGALLNMVINKKQLEIEIPAIEQHFDNDHVKLATLVGLALGQAPTGIDPQEYLRYKHEVLKVFVAGLRQIEQNIRAEVEEQEGKGGDGDGAEEDTGDEDDKEGGDEKPAEAAAPAPAEAAPAAAPAPVAPPA